LNPIGKTHKDAPLLNNCIQISYFILLYHYL